MKKILVPIDYSEASRSAGHFAIQFALAAGSEIRFVDVFPALLAGTTPSFDPDKIDQNPLAYEYGKLKKFVSSLVDDLGLVYKNEVYPCVAREGNNIRKQILEEAHEYGATLIITGAGGHSKIRSWLLGSETWNLVKHTLIPVMTIPEKAVFNKMDKIVFATEYRQSEIPAIHFVARFAAMFDAHLSVLHISKHLLKNEIAGVVAEDFIKEMTVRVSYKKLTTHITYNDHLVDGLNEFCEEAGADIMVVSPERLSFIDRLINPVELSDARRISIYTRFPLLILPDFKDTDYAEMVKIS